MLEVVTPGKRLLALRRRANLTQQQVADHIGISGSAVGQWERDTTKPLWTQLAALDELLAAEGEVLEIFGYTVPETDRVTREDLRAITAAIERLAARVEAIEQRDFVDLPMAASGAKGRPKRGAAERIVARPRPPVGHDE